MTVETTALRQKAVLWMRLRFNRNGDPVLDDPVEIKVRWEASSNEAATGEGGPKASPVTVDVDREIVIGSRLWKGKLVDLPTSPTNIHQVVSADSIPDVKGREEQRTVTLARI